MVGGSGGLELVPLAEVNIGSHAHLVTGIDHTHQLPMHATAAEGGASYGLVSGGPFTGRVIVGSGYTTPNTNAADRSLNSVTDYRGGGAPHLNTQPTRIMNKIIRYL